LSLLVAITAIAMALACHVASRLMGAKYPARKTMAIAQNPGSAQASTNCAVEFEQAVSPSSQVINTPSENVSGQESRSVDDFEISKLSH
jgi:hypothetical protein